MAKKEFATKTRQEVYLESHRGRRSEPAGLSGLRKQVKRGNRKAIEAWKQASKAIVPEVRREDKVWACCKETTPGKRQRWGKGQVCSRECAGPHTGAFVSRACICFPKVGILGGVSREDLNRILSVLFRGCGLY